LATKIIEVGGRQALVYPGTYSEFLWHKDHPSGQSREPHQATSPPPAKRRAEQKGGADHKGRPDQKEGAGHTREHRKQAERAERRKDRAEQARRAQVDALEARIAETEKAIREIEEAMAAPGFYDDRAAAQPVIDRHQALMWQVGELMHQWEELQTLTNASPD
jgi:hypothetical protein